MEGEATAFKTMKDGKVERVFEYKAHNYFGELALLKSAPRAASIVAKVRGVNGSLIWKYSPSKESRLNGCSVSLRIFCSEIQKYTTRK